MEVEVTFKTYRQAQEWNDPDLDPRLRAILLAVADHVQRNYDKPLVITSIWRSHEEQISIYGVGTTKRSPHQFWRAIDIRTWIYEHDEVMGIIAFLNKWWPRQDGKPLALYHDVGRGAHLHIQVPYKVHPV